MLITKKKRLVFSTQISVFHFTLSRVFVKPVTVPNMLCGLWQTPGSDNAVLTWAQSKCQQEAECWFVSADASSEFQPQILGSLELAEAHGYPAKSPFQPLVVAHLITWHVVQGRWGGNPPAWTALHLIKHLCYITKMLLHSSDILLLRILIKYLNSSQMGKVEKNL